MRIQTLFCIAPLFAASLGAQVITWGPVQVALSPLDVSLNGTLVVARNLHAAGASQTPTVNGVTFTGSFAPSGWNNASTLALNGSTTGDTGYDLLLNSARATSAAATANPTGWGAIRVDNLGTFQAGVNYEIQCWFTDQRPGTGAAAIYDRQMELSSAVGTATLTGGEVNNLPSLVQGPVSDLLDGDPDNAPALGAPDVLYGSHCTGTFTWVPGNQLWLLVRGSHPIPTNNLRSHLTAFQIRELPTPTWSAYGAACAGPAGPSGLSLVSLPAIGGVFALDVDNAGPGFTFMLTGLTQLNIPIPFPEFVPGCTALTTPDIAQFIPTVGGVASWSLAIPNTPSLAGVSLFNQALELGALLSLSDGGAGTIQ